MNDPRRFPAALWMGGLFVLAGVSLTPAYVASVSALPFFMAASGTASPVLWYDAIASLLFLGASLLVLNGVATIAGASTSTRRVGLLAAAAVSLVLLAIWAIVSFARAEVSPAMFLEGCGVALAVGVLLTLLLKKAWVGALIGAVLSMPLCVRNLQFVLIDVTSSTFAFHTIVAAATVALWLAALICALLFRFP